MKRLWRVLCLALVSGAADAQQFNAPLTPSVAVTPVGPLSFTPAKIVNPVDFGAQCDGKTDDTIALQNAIGAIADNSAFYVPGVCLFTAPLVFPSRSFGLTISGKGRGSQLIYKGASTTDNLITVGTFNYTTAGYCSTVRFSMHDIGFASSTVMTGGDGVQLNDVCDSEIHNVYVGGGFGQTGDLLGNQNFYNGVHFNGGNSVHVRSIFASAGQGGSAVLVNGDVAQQFSDLFIEQGKIIRSKYGLNVAGNVGGLVMDQVEMLVNSEHIRVSQDQVPVVNSAIFLGSQVFVDVQTGAPSGGAGIGINIVDPGATSAAGSSWLKLDGTWLASSTNQCMEISAGANWNVIYTGGNVSNCGGGGIRNDSANSVVTIAGTRFWNNANFDVSNTVPANKSIAALGVWTNSGTFTSGAGGVVRDFSGASGSRTISTLNNLNLLANAGFTAILGIHNDCLLAVNSGGLVTPKTEAGVACSGYLGSSSAPWGAIYATAPIATGAPPTIAGACSITTQVGGNTAGSFAFNGACASGALVLTFANAAPNGWICDVQDMTTAGASIRRTGFTPTTATFAVTGALAADQVSFKCSGM